MADILLEEVDEEADATAKEQSYPEKWVAEKTVESEGGHDCGVEVVGEPQVEGVEPVAADCEDGKVDDVVVLCGEE